MLSAKQRGALFEKLKGRYNKKDTLPSVKSPDKMEMPDAPKTPKELKSVYSSTIEAEEVETPKKASLSDLSTSDPAEIKYVGKGRKVRFLKLKRALGAKK